MLKNSTKFAHTQYLCKSKHTCWRCPKEVLELLWDGHRTQDDLAAIMWQSVKFGSLNVFPKILEKEAFVQAIFIKFHTHAAKLSVQRITKVFGKSVELEMQILIGVRVASLQKWRSPVSRTFLRECCENKMHAGLYYLME